LVDQHIIVKDGYFESITKVWFQRVKVITCDRGPQRAETDVQNVNRPTNQIILYDGFNHWKF